jgi:hypothetical protein
MPVDISPITDAAVQLVGALVLAIGGIAITFLSLKVNTWLGVKISAGNQAAFNAALSQSVTFGITQAEGAIKAHGWDDPTVKNVVLAAAATAITTKFPDALAAVGITGDLNSPANVALVQEALQRALPAAALTASASPSTPPAPTPPVIVAPVTPAA